MTCFKKKNEYSYIEVSQSFNTGLDTYDPEGNNNFYNILEDNDESSKLNDNIGYIPPSIPEVTLNDSSSSELSDDELFQTVTEEKITPLIQF